MKRGHIPVRTCKACGRKAPKTELVRMVLLDGRLSADENRHQTGRGIYCCREKACGERLAGKSGKRRKKVVPSAQKRKEDGSNR